MSSALSPVGGPTVVVVGRPNVGKSTLVNRMTGRRDAIVQERPGVTRDRSTHAADWAGAQFTVIDTGGWTPGWARADDLGAAVTAQAEVATASADLIVFVVDATVGITEEDAAAAGWLRATGRPLLLVANKADSLGRSGAATVLEADLAELYSLGVGEAMPVSALHGRGSGDLLDAIVARLRETGALDRIDDRAAADPAGIALIGRPNVGKSSLFNRLVGAERTIVHERPGTTRDAVDTLVTLPSGQRYRFVDTAGLRRKARKTDSTEYYSSVRTVQALDASALALLVVDAADGITEQDQRLARQILDAGRALVLVLNKWDLVDDEARRVLERGLDRMLGFIDFAETVRISALTGRGVHRLPDVIDQALTQWRLRVPTAQLNVWLADAVAANPPPLRGGRPTRLRYITQVSTGPPAFVVFTTASLSPGYLRYLQRRLRERFGFAGSPLRLSVRVRDRPAERG